MKCRSTLKSFFLFASILTTLFFSASAQSWTALSNRTGRTCSGPPLLLSDGSVMVDGYDNAAGFPGKQWNRLSPDSLGSYSNGTWDNLASMHDTRACFSSQLLKDGRLYVAGAEYGTGGSTAEIFDPLANTWTYTSAPGFQGSMVDANSEILSNGTVLQGAVFDNGSKGNKIYNPVTNTWGATFLSLHSEDESSFSKLPDGSIIFVDFLLKTSERFIPSLGYWIADANVPVSLYDTTGGEVGGSYLLPNGKLFYVGATGHTAIYTPSGSNSAGSWIAGPNLPDNTGQKDAAGCMMATGKILLAASPLTGAEYDGPTYFYEYNYATNSYTRVVAPGGGTSISSGCFQTYMCALPNGQVLLGLYEVNDQYYVYSPIGYGAVVASGKPTITQVVQDSCGHFTLTGKLLGGISEGAGYGDDAQSFSNYPIIKLVSRTRVYYARTYNWSTRDVQQGNTSATVQFTLPSALAHGSYTLSVSVNGISSDTSNFMYSTCSPTVILNPYTYYKIVNRSSSKVLDVKNSSTADNANIVQQTYTAITSQQWRVVSQGNGNYNIINRNSGKEIDDYQGDTTNGRDMVQYTLNPTAANHIFQVKDNGDGYYRVINQSSFKELDDSSASQVNGTNITQWAPNGGVNHEWLFVDLGIVAPVAVLPQGKVSDKNDLLNTTDMGPELVPNPATNFSSLVFSVTEKTLVMIRVQTENGKLVHAEQIHANAGVNKINLNVSSYSSGVYFVTISEGNKSITKRLIVTK